MYDLLLYHLLWPDVESNAQGKKKRNRQNNDKNGASLLNKSILIYLRSIYLGPLETLPLNVMFVYGRELSHIRQSLISKRFFVTAPVSELPAGLLAALLSVTKFSRTPCPALGRPPGSQEGRSLACRLWEPRHAWKTRTHSHKQLRPLSSVLDTMCP